MTARKFQPKAYTFRSEDFLINAFASRDLCEISSRHPRVVVPGGKERCTET